MGPASHKGPTAFSPCWLMLANQKLQFAMQPKCLADITSTWAALSVSDQGGSATACWAQNERDPQLHPWPDRLFNNEDASALLRTTPTADSDARLAYECNNQKVGGWRRACVVVAAHSEFSVAAANSVTNCRPEARPKTPSQVEREPTHGRGPNHDCSLFLPFPLLHKLLPHLLVIRRQSQQTEVAIRPHVPGFPTSTPARSPLSAGLLPV